MDLAEKRKQLEALRAARQAKQQVVDQYMSSRVSNPDGSPTLSASLTSTPAEVASPSNAAVTTGITSLASPKSMLALPTAHSARTSGAAVSRTATTTTTRRFSNSTTAKMASSPDTTALPTMPASQKVRTSTPTGRHVDPSSFSSKPQASPSYAQGAATATAAAAAPSSTPSPTAAASPQLIQVLHVRKDDRTSPTTTTAAAAAIAVGGAPPSARRPTSVPPADAPRTPRSGASPPATATVMTTSGGWGLLHHGTRGIGGAASATTQPACIFNPSVLLGDGGSGGSAEESRRRVVLDATACLVPYHGAVATQRPRGHGGHGDGDDPQVEAESGGAPVWSVCVAAAYGSAGAGPGMTGPSGSGGGGGGSGGGGVGGLPGSGEAYGYDMRGGAVSSAAAGDPLSARGIAGSFAGPLQHSPLPSALPGSAAAAAAAAGVRASMECGYPWGCASAAPSAAAATGSTMDAALRVAKSAPGLVLAWFVVPLPPNTIPRNEGPFAGAAAGVAGGGGGPAAASANAARDGAGGNVASGADAAAADYVTVVLPLVCDSVVTTLLAHPFQPSTLLGGTRCGRIVQWSMGQAWSQVEPRRLSERALATTGTTTTLLLPPQRPAHSSFPSPQAHQAPILRMAIHGDASCHHLYSISQEGKVCTWPAWQPLHPTASCLSYLGIRPMGSIGVAAEFVERPGTDAMTKVFIGTTSGALLVGANRDAKSIELQYYGPPRPLPTSSTVIKTLDVTATASPELPGAEHGNLSHSPMSSLRRSAMSSQSSSPAAAAAAAAAAPHPHRGRVVAMALQTSTHGLRGRDCVVSAATDGSCVAWFDRSVVPLEGFSSAVTSVCWSPTRPGILAAGDASGLVTVWSVNVSIITPVATVSLRDAGRRARGNAASDGVLWVVAGSSDSGAGAATAMGGGAGYSYGSGGAAASLGLGGDEDEADLADGEEVTTAPLGQADVVGAAICAVFFSRDGQWLFASTASGFVHTLRLSSALY